MKYAIQLHAGGYSVVIRGEKGPTTYPYSNAPEVRDRWLTFDTQDEAELAIPAVREAVGVTGEYTVITVSEGS